MERRKLRSHIALSFKDLTILQNDLVMQGSNAAWRKECCTVPVAREKRVKLPKELADLTLMAVGTGSTLPYEKPF